MEQQQKQLGQFRHDMNNHMQMIYAYRKENDYNAAVCYLEQFEKETQHIHRDILGIDIFDLCTIFANALDNALEACRCILFDKL